MVQPSVDEIVKSIASDFNTSSQEVLKMYEARWAELSEGARIFDYLTVLVIKRVRDDLRYGRLYQQIGNSEQIAVPRLDAGDDQKRAVDELKHDVASDARTHQAPNEPPNDEREFCGRPLSAEEVPVSLGFARL